jgi:hypothetical protein
MINTKRHNQALKYGKDTRKPSPDKEKVEKTLTFTPQPYNIRRLSALNLMSCFENSANENAPVLMASYLGWPARTDVVFSENAEIKADIA